MICFSLINAVHCLEQTSNQQANLWFRQRFCPLAEHGLKGHGKVLEVDVVGTAIGAKWSGSYFYFDHADEIGAVVVGEFEFVYELVLCVCLQNELIDCANHLLVGQLVVKPFNLPEVVHLNTASGLEAVSGTDALLWFDSSHI